MRTRWTGRKTLAVCTAVALLLLPGCAGSRLAAEREARNANTGGSGGMVSELFLEAESDASIGTLVNYNPYAPKQQTKNWLYEPLMIQDPISCTILPWLATKYRWQGNAKLIFDIREGVKWSDGSDFTPADVAFTFNLMKKYPSIDSTGVWKDIFGAPATSVTAVGQQVIFQFAGPAVSKFQNLVGLNLIVSEKEYGSVGDPSKFIDKTPISTGPFKIGSYNGRRLELLRRDDYWQADKIKVQKLVLEGKYDANQAALKLRNGGLDYFSGEIPNPQKTFVDPDPALNHFYYAPNGITAVIPNTTVKPFSDVKFREAMAYAMDKKTASLKATFGIMDGASQSGLTLPAKAGLLPAGYPAETTVLPFDTAKANQILDDAGYAKGAGGTRSNPDGSPITIDFAVQAGYIDYEATADQVASNLRDLGLTVQVTKSPPDSVDALKKNGRFGLMIGYVAAGCDYANGLGASLSTGQISTATEIRGNLARYSDPRVDAAVAELTATNDPARVKELVGVLVTTMMTQYPVIPMFYAPARSIYRTQRAEGWPSAEDPYFDPGNLRVLMTHLSAPR